MDTNYLSKLSKFLTNYMDTVKKKEPLNSATQQLSSVLHSNFVKPEITCIAGTRHITVATTYSYSKTSFRHSQGKSTRTLRKVPKPPVSGEAILAHRVSWQRQLNVIRYLARTWKSRDSRARAVDARSFLIMDIIK